MINALPRVEGSKHKADMEKVLGSGFNKRPNKLCKVRVHRVTLQPLRAPGVGTHARAPSAAHGICEILKEEREKKINL